MAKVSLSKELFIFLSLGLMFVQITFILVYLPIVDDNIIYFSYLFYLVTLYDCTIITIKLVVISRSTCFRGITSGFSVLADPGGIPGLRARGYYSEPVPFQCHN